MLKKITSWLTNPKVVLFSTSAAYLGKHVYYFLTNPQFDLYWDAPGHLQKAQILTWPWSGGWDTTFWGGYPTAAYPSFAHYILRLFINIFHNDRLAVGAVVILSSIYLLCALYKLIKKSNVSAKLQPWIFLTTVCLWSLASPSILGILQANVATGALSATVALPLFLSFLASSSWITAGFFLGLLFQTHMLTASAGCFFWLCQFITHNNNERKHDVFALLLAFLIGLSAILPLVDPSFGSVAINLGSISSSPLVISFIVLIILILTTLKINPYSLACFGFGIICLLPNPFINKLQLLGIHGLHAYRYQVFYLSLLPLTVCLLNQIKKTVVIKLPAISQAALLMIALSVIILNPIPSSKIKIKLFPLTYQSLTGRVIDVSSPENGQLFPHALQHIIPSTSRLLGADGLFYESSAHASEIYSFKHMLNPQTYIAGAPTAFFENNATKTLSDATQSAELLGINYMVISGNQDLATPSSDLFKIGETVNSQTQQVENYFFLNRLTNTTLIQPLTALPQVDHQIDLGKWWTETNHTLLVVKNPLPPTIATSAAAISNITIQPTKISFRIEGQLNTPVFIKFSYSPYWQATTLNGATTQPQWITPGYMLLSGYGDIVLDWVTPYYLQLAGFISPLIIIVTLLLIALRPNKTPLKRGV